MRMCEDIQHKNPVLIGVSFGGVLAQEMSRFIDLKKVIIISSVKNTNELRLAVKGYPKNMKQYGDISLWDVSNVQNMKRMFYRSQFNGDISRWDVSNVKDMSYMFNKGDISRWAVKP